MLIGHDRQIQGFGSPRRAYGNLLGPSFVELTA